MTNRLRAKQTEAVKHVTRGRDIGLLGLLVVLLMWPDVMLPYCLVTGFPAVGYGPNCGVFAEKPAKRSTLSEVLQGAEETRTQILQQLGPGPDDEVIMQKTQEDVAAGFCTEALTQRQLESRLQGRCYHVIRRFLIKQANGKCRVCDHAEEGGRTEWTEDANKLVLCSALRPGQHIQMVVDAAKADGYSLDTMDEEFQSGGEDWPNAYRVTPQAEQDAECCVVVYFHPQ